MPGPLCLHRNLSTLDACIAVLTVVKPGAERKKQFWKAGMGGCREWPSGWPLRRPSTLLNAVTPCPAATYAVLTIGCGFFHWRPITDD